MRVGEVVGGRFELAEEAGSGGMGTVYRAVDREDGSLVAVKVLSRADADAAARFVHESRVLAELRHPNIVRYIRHGITDRNEPYLAMEWLEGESLEDRLYRARLTIPESMEVLRRVAEALSLAHERGIIHRDIKPGNVFLVNRSVERIKLLDFGIARTLGISIAVTKTDGILGTPGYMAPEQARGELRSVGASADVFSLGTVVFECLTGKPAFQGAHVVALLAKVLWEDAPRLRELLPRAPQSLDRLVARMLARDPAERLQDGAAVLKALDRLGDPEAEEGASAPAESATISGTEKRLVSVVAVSQSARSKLLSSTLPNPGTVRPVPAEIRRVVAPFGARVEELANGMFVAVLVGAGNAVDQAALAARSALRMRALLPESRVVLMTGWAEEAGRLPVGAVLDRAASLMETADPAREEAESEPYAHVHLDDVTSALLDARFDVVEENGDVLLRGERDVGDSLRMLLGKPTPFVGRDRELRSLVDLVKESFEDGVARAVLVTAEPGMGKSRLRYELLQRIRDDYPGAAIGLGRADAINAGSAFATMASAFRSALRIGAGDPSDVQREGLAFGVNLVVPEPERRRILELLGEMIGVPSPGEESPGLRAARQNALVMADQIQGAFIDFLRPLAQSRPTLLLLEDLHWGDSPSVKLLDVALRELAGLPFVVVAFARPSVHDVFPKLWAGRDFQQIRLGALPQRAATVLAQSALGKSCDPHVVASIVERAAGNAFYLEELIRAVAKGRREGLPETILGMLEARLSALDPDVRRTLRAASVFGDVFWKGGVDALLADSASAARDCLAVLIDQELILSHAKSRLPAESEYVFRHGLIREVAYAMLPDRDRVSAHRRAAEWLDRAGETDAMILAEHFEQGNEPARASEFYLRAAEAAHRAGDSVASMERARRGLAWGVPEELEIRLLGLLSEAHMWRNEWATAAEHGEKVFRSARPGSASWVRAATARLVHSMHRGEIDRALATIDAVYDSSPSGEALDAAGLALALGVVFLVTTGRTSLAKRTLMRLHTLVEPLEAILPMARAWMHLGHPRFEAWVNEDPFAGLRHSEEALQSFRQALYERGENLALVFIGMNAWMLGARHAAERALRQAAGGEAEFALVASLHSLLLVFVLAEGGHEDEALIEAQRALAASEAGTSRSDQGRARWAMAEALRRTGRVEEAEEEARKAVDLLVGLPLDQAASHTTLATIQLQRGDSRGALETVRRGLARFDELGGHGYFGAQARLLHAEALRAEGQTEAARAVIEEARERLLLNAEKIDDAELKRSFLEDVPENRRTLALAAEWAAEARG